MMPPVRIQHNMLAVAERRLLTWLAARLPPWVTPDRLTSLGFVAALAIGAGYALSHLSPAWLWLSIIAFFINWFGDSLDGSLARFRKIERPSFGYFVDHSADALGNLAIVGGIGLSPYVRLDVALFALVAYLLLSIHTFLKAKVVDEFNLTYLAGGPTEMRIILIGMTLAMLYFGPGKIGNHAYSGFDIFAAGFAVMLLAVFVVQTAALGYGLRKKGK